jgi:hypothetical protein
MKVKVKRKILLEIKTHNHSTNGWKNGKNCKNPLKSFILNAKQIFNSFSKNLK